MKRVLILLGVVIAAAVLWSFRTPAITVEVVQVDRGPLEETLEQEGQTRIRDVYPMLATVDGSLRRIELEPGDPVVAGETIVATIDPPPVRLLDARTREEIAARISGAEAGVKQAEARVSQAEEQRRLAEVEYLRLRDLVAEGDASKSSRDAAERLLRSWEGEARRAAAGVVIAEQELAGARAALARGESSTTDGDSDPEPIRLLSPIDGVVLRVMRESAGPIMTGAPLVEVGDRSDIEIVADYLTTDAVQITPGLRARIVGWGGDPLSAIVRRVEPQGVTKISALGVEEQRVDVICDLDPLEKDRAASLGSGFRVEVEVITWSGDSVLRVPEGGLFRGADGEWALYRLDGDRAVETTVRIGHRDGRHAEVLEGVREGESLILHPPDAVIDGARVTVEE